MNKPLSVFDLLNGNHYSIPLYQRNFAWTDIEITQLIIDILDSIKEKRPEYYIGTLVVSKNDDVYSIIDGQQRVTAILLIAFAIQNEYSISKKRVEKVNLSFLARKRSDETLNSLFTNDMNTGRMPEGELYRGYNETVSALKEHIGSSDYIDISIDNFNDYLFDKVKVFISEMPKNLNVNLYFERFNSRGEQLEYHEVIKAELMQRLVTEGIDFATVQKFAKVWDACSEIDTPCINFFKKKIKGTDANEERETVFQCEWSDYEQGKNSWRYGYGFENIYSKIVVNEESKKTLISAIEESDECITATNTETTENEEFNKYRCIVNFNTFLYYVLYLTDNVSPDSIQLDDKKLKSAFKATSRNSQWILKFGKNLLKAKFIFDNLIIRDSLETTDRRKKGEWFLQKTYREDKNEKVRGLLYVQTRFDKNSFSNNNHEILMLQSMFAVTFTAYKDTKWLYTTLKYLFENAEKLNRSDFGNQFYAFMESLSKTFSKERIYTNGGIDPMKLRYDNSVPVYAFNLTDYLLWRNREKLRSIFTTIKFDDFRFTYRRSIEHWYPQNPNETEGKTKLSDDLLHCFGNLCLIVASQNSAFGNLYPLAKLANWREIFNTQSLKLQMMAVNTHTWSSWDETKRTEILAMEEDIMQMLENYMYENLQGDKPYKDGEKLYLDVEQIIPIKDIGDYQIHLTAKKQEETVSSIEEAARHETRYKFWEKALPVLRVKTGAYSNVSPSKDNWLTGASGHRGVSFNPIILMGGARAELYIDTGNEQWNTSIFEKLKSKETEIDSSFLGMVIWQELPGKRARRICVQYHDYGLNNDEHWDDIIDWLSNNIAALMKVLKPLLDVIMKSVE